MQFSRITIISFSKEYSYFSFSLVNEVQTLYIASGDIGGFFAVNEDGPPQPSAELSLWDDVCVYGNGLVEALNNLRFSLSPMIVSSVFSSGLELIVTVLLFE